MSRGYNITPFSASFSPGNETMQVLGIKEKGIAAADLMRDPPRVWFFSNRRVLSMAFVGSVSFFGTWNHVWF